MSNMLSEFHQKHPNGTPAAWYGSQIIAAGVFLVWYQLNVSEQNVTDFIFISDNLADLELALAGGLFFYALAAVYQGVVALCDTKNEADHKSLINAPRVLGMAGAACMIAASGYLFSLAFLTDPSSNWAVPSNSVETGIFGAVWGSVFAVSAVTLGVNAKKIKDTIWP